MHRSRPLNAVVTLGLIVALGCTRDNAGCAGCLEPLPGGALPADQTLEGGMQVRVTRAGLEHLRSVVAAVITDALTGQGICLPRQSIDAFVADGQACYEYHCNGGAEGCQVNLMLQDVVMSAPDDDTFRIRAVFDVDTSLDIRIRVLGITVRTCDMGVKLEDGDVTADIGFVIDPATGELGVRLQNLDVALDGFDASNCGIIDNVADFLVDIVSSPLGGFLIDLLTPVIGDLISGFLPDPLGLEGLVDVGALLGSISPGTNATLEARLVPGGYVGLAAEGLSLGLITGFNADQEPATRAPELDSEPALCVPPFAAPDFAAAPHELARTARGTFSLAAAEEFLGVPDPATDLAIGVSETFLDLVGHHAVSSGALCLGVGTELISQLNLGLIGVLVPSLQELGSERGDDPLLLVLRPTRPLDFSIGEGTEDDPSISIHFQDLAVDFYAYLFQRYVRGFTMSLTMDVGINLSFTFDDQGRPALEPQLVGLSSDNIQLTVLNSEFLREDEASLERVLPSIFDLAVPLIADGIGPIALPELAGFTLSDIRITKVATSEDEFLALFGSLLASDALMTRLGDAAVPGGQLEALIAAQRLPPPRPVETVARLVAVTTPSVGELRDWAAQRPGGALPKAVLALAGADAEPRALEWSWRLDGGMWRPWTRNRELVIQERALAWQGRHHIEVKARAVGDPRSIDMTPESFELVLDTQGPRLLRSTLRRDGANLVVEAHDLVMPDGGIEFGFGRAGDGPASGWRRPGRLPLGEAAALAVDGSLTIYTRDELGNESIDEVDVTGILEYHGRTDGNGGCDCAVAGHTPGLGAVLLALGVALRLRRRRAPRARRDRRGGLRVAALALAAAFGPACSGDGGGPEPAACEVDLDCNANCLVGEIGVCFEGQCLCSDDIPTGTVGQYAAIALASTGVAWVSAYNSTYGDLVVARWPDSGRIPNDAWQFVDGVPDGPVVLPTSEVRGGIRAKGDDVGRATSIAIAGDEVVSVSYFDATHNALKYASNAGGTWTSHVIDAGVVASRQGSAYEVVGEYSSIVVRAGGRPSIAYFAQIYDGAGTLRSELRFAAAATAAPSAAADWSIYVADAAAVALDPESADPGLVAEGVGLFVDAAVRRDGAPVLAYYDRIHGDLRLASFDAVLGTFAEPTVLAGDDATDVGWYPSVAVDADDLVHVSYLSATADDLMYVTARSAPELVDDGRRIDGTTPEGLPKPVFHFVGDDSCVVMTNVGPVITYQDATTHELLVAARNNAGNWEFKAVAGAESTFVGGYGFYADAAFDGQQVVISNWVLDQPSYDAWVEIHRELVVVE
jgi:MYXO-CTERM domain-containing protein